MSWVKVQLDQVAKIRYDEATQSLKIVFGDRSSAVARGVTSERYSELVDADVLDQQTYFRNIIEPHITQRGRKPPSIRRAVLVTFKVLATLASIWLLFSITEYIRLRH